MQDKQSVPGEMNNTIEARVKAVVAEHQFVGRKPIPVNEVDLNLTFADMGLDSLDHVDMVFDFEDEFEFHVPDDDADKFKTPADMVTYVREHKLEG